MKLTVFKVYDEIEDWENSTWHYEYALTPREVKYLERILVAVPYSKKEYDSIYDFLTNEPEIADDTYDAEEALEFVLETIKAIECSNEVFKEGGTVKDE